MGRFAIGNWKCNKNLDEGRKWLDIFASDYRPHDSLQVIIAPPMIWLRQLYEHLTTLELPGVSLAAQDVSSFPAGSYTGAIAADMLKGTADHVLVGHIERRRYFHETQQDVVNKVSEAAEAGITPVVCVDKTYAMSQLTSLNDIDCPRLLVAYCPESSHDYPQPEAVDKVEEAVHFISGISHPSRPIVYGGAVTTANARLYSAIPGLSGLFVGAASLDPHSFAQICQEVAANSA